MDRKEPGTVSIYTIMAELFAALAEEVVTRFGSEGELAVRQAVRNFGEMRGRRIAENARQSGKDNTVANYLPFYDMERSLLFTAESQTGANEVRQCFSKCIFADAWKNLQAERYGLLYCEEIDPAIARGFNSSLQCEHKEYLLKGGTQCTFRFFHHK